MPPSDKNKSTSNSSSGEGQTQLCSESCEMDFQAESTSPSTSNVTLSGHGSIVNIPWVTASQSTMKCSVNDQMKTFDPGEGVGVDRLISSNSGNSVFLGKNCSSLIKNSNKNYKAGSKINKLADMLAKRSQNVVEVKQNTSDKIVDINSAPKLNDETVVLKSVSNDVKSVIGSFLENNTTNNEVKSFRKSRRKSVPNQSYSLQHWQSQSTSKSCSDIFELFPLEENERKTEHNALGSFMNDIQTDESTKKKADRTNLKSMKSTPVVPEKTKSLRRSETLCSSKTIEEDVGKNIENTLGKCLSKSTEKPVNKLMDEIMSKSMEKSTKILVENFAEEVIGKPIEKYEEIVIVKTVEKSGEKSTEKGIEEILDKPTEKDVDKTVGKSAENKIIHQSKEKAIEAPYGKSAETVKENFTEKSMEGLGGKSVDTPKEKIIKAAVENVMEKPQKLLQENLKEISLEYSIKKLAEIPQKTQIEKLAEKIIEEPMERFVKKPKEKIIKKLVEKSKEYSAEKPIGETAEKHNENPMDKPRDNSIEKLVKKPNEKSVVEKRKEKSFENSVEKPKEKHSENLMEKFIERPTKKLVESFATCSKEKVHEKSKEQLINVFLEDTLEKPKQEIMEIVSQKNIELSQRKNNEKFFDKSFDKPKEKSIEKCKVVPLEKLKENPSGKSKERPPEKSNEVVEKPREKIIEKTKKNSSERLEREVQGKGEPNPLDQSKEKVVEKSRENGMKKLVKSLAENPKEEVAENSREKVVEKLKEKAVDQILEISVKKFNDKVEDKMLESPEEKFKEQFVEKSREKSRKKLIEKGFEKNSKRNKEKSRRRMRDRTMDDHSPTQIETIRKTRERSCKNTNATSSVRSLKHGDSYSKKKETKAKQKKSKRLVESSTQTADIEFFSVIKPSNVETELTTMADILGSDNVKVKKCAAVETEKPESENQRLKIVTYECLYCTQTFNVWALCKAHEKTHAPRKYKQFRCQYCSKKLFSLEEFKNHCILKHRNKYAYCKKCDFRFSTKDELYSHNKEVHLRRNGESPKVIPEERPKTPGHEIVPTQEVLEVEKTNKNLLEDKADKEIIQEKIMETLAEEKTDQKIPEQKSLLEASEVILVQNFPEEKAFQKATEEDTLLKTPEETVLKTTEEKAMKKTPEKKSIQKILEEKPDKEISEERAIKKVVEEKVKEISEEKAFKKVPEEKAIRKIPEEKVVKKFPTDKAVKKVSEEKAVKKLPEEKAEKKIVEEKGDKKVPKSAPKTDLRIDVSFDSTKKSSVSPRSGQRCSPKENKTEEQILEMEMLFYSHLSGNIQENLTNHLDGKIDQSGIPVRRDQIVDVPESTKNTSLLSVAVPTSGAPDVQILRAPSPYQTRSKTPNPLPPTAKKFKKLPNWQQKFWEKYNFPTNYRYQHRFWDKNYLNTEKSAFYLKDLSCLDIKTQLTMRDNIKKLDEVKKIEESSKPANELKFPEYLSLIPRANKVNILENKVDLQKNNLECGKTKKQVGKEDTKKSLKSPASELPGAKNRSKASSDSSSDNKKQSSEGLKMVTRRQSSLESAKDDKEENSKKRKGSLDLSGIQRMALRRQTSLDNAGSNVPKAESDQVSGQNVKNSDLDNSPLSPAGSTEISGEWVRPRSYLCGTCCTKFTNLWELEDHKWVSHPNVWCTHYEFEDEKIDKLFQKIEGDGSGESGETSEMSKSKLTDLYKRYLLPHGYLKTAKLVPKTNFPEECTKCKKNCMNSSEMHKHMLDCGGDTTWFLTMYSSPMTIKRKWRPFGSRRKKQIGRRDVKRNIPSTPTLRSYHYQHRIRTKPGDVETIQKMLANLPEKRARRAINFDEIKTRSQATIHSNRLLRKRFKSNFSNNFLKLKNMKQKRQLKQGKKEGSSKSTTDTSSESTPVGSPKRKNKLKESLQLLKEENSRDGSSENSEDVTKTQKKKIQKKKVSPDMSQKKNQILRADKLKLKKEMLEVNQEKPITRSNGFVLSQETKTKKKACVIKEEILDEVECSSSSPTETKRPKLVSKSGKNAKKNTGKAVKSVGQKEAVDSENMNLTSSMTDLSDKEPPVKLAKKIKTETSDTPEFKPYNRNNPHWINPRCNPILRLKQNSKAKSELLKSIRKKVKNSKKILEKKEAEKAEGGSRRSLRLKSLQQVEHSPEPLDKQISEQSKRMDSIIVEKDLKIKTVVVSLENAIPGKAICKGPKTGYVKGEKETAEDILPIVRRSLRNSVSSEDKQENQKNNGSNVIPFNPRSVLRRNLRNEKIDSSGSDAVIVNPKMAAVLQKNPNVKNIVENKHGTTQVSLLKKNNIPNPKNIRGIIKAEDVSEVKKLEVEKSKDLEEMPILAKVEPIRGKIFNKTEKEIPVLMPVEKEQKRGLNDDDEFEEDSISFQVIKKRRKNSKEITPLKIVKRLESVSSENGNDFGSSFRIKSNEGLEEGVSDSRKSKKNKHYDVPASKATEKKIKTNVKKYFLGIDPNEIDKGRWDGQDGQDESGSDNEPLICLVNNQDQVQNDFRKDELNVKDENVEAESSKNQLPLSPKSPVESSKAKTDSKQELRLSSTEETDETVCHSNNTQAVCQVSRETLKIKKNIKKKKKTSTNSIKELRVTVMLKEPTLKLIKNFSLENKWSEETSEPKRSEILPVPSNSKEILPDGKESNLPERRSRRISRETKSTNEFVIDDPLILVDELWSDLDSDSDSSKRKNKKGKKKSPKKKTSEEKKMSDVNLEELLRNFGENKECQKTNRLPVIKIVRKRKEASVIWESRRKTAENRQQKESYRRLSLKLFRFNKSYKNFGNRGIKLSEAKKALQEKLGELHAKSSNALPDLPFLAAEIKENPVQVIQCGTQKPKTMKKGSKKVDLKHQSSDIHLKISLPLEAINDIPVFNNNHLTEPILEEPKQSSSLREKIPDNSKTDKEVVNLMEAPLGKESQLVEDEVVVFSDDVNDTKNKSKRSDVIDKIFYCEICKTYYYSSSQLKIHKLSNRHKVKELELHQLQEGLVQSDTYETVKIESSESQSSCTESVPVVENILREPSKIESVEEERLNDDTLEMPTLEGPFIEGPVTRLPVEPVQVPSPPPPVPSFGFTQESLKDIQKAIGCTDEEMLILTLLGENTIEVENDILDLDSCKSVQSKPSECAREKNDSGLKENEKANGAFKVDLKQRMTSALACLVNKAVFNLLQKYENAAKTAVNSEALSLLGKLSNLSRRKNVLQLNELLKKRSDGESSVSASPREIEKKEPSVSYKYQCTICGNRFEKASTRECHISRSHRGKAKKLAEDLQSMHAEEEWNDSWSYDVGDDHLESTTTSQFWCSDCGINFVSPQEVLDHQKIEHQAGLKDTDQNRDSSPLQSSTIGSSDEILEGKKSRKRPKLFSSEELNQQRIIANNELRKLDRRFSSKSKSSKTKWGMDALKFTVEKENKAVVDEEEKEIVTEESLKPPMDVKSIDLVPKLNLSRISNIPEFKVIQKNSFENRFQKIIDNKLKRKFACPSQEENVVDDVEEEVMLVPVVVKKKNKKQKLGKCSSKKEEAGKPLDVYDFNDTESEGEPAVYSHIKKPVTPMKIKLVKEKERPSKNKADSTTKDLAPDDYDSEDSLPLSVVKKSKPGDEDDEKDEKISEDGVEKSDGILEQVEYLIEQLENETGSLKNENVAQASEIEQESDIGGESEKSEFLKESSENAVYTSNESLRVSVASKFLEMDEILLKNHKCDKSNEEKSELQLENDRVEESQEPERESVLAEPESSQSTFDEEDSIPLVLISKKANESKFNSEIKKCDENTTDVSTTASEDVSLLRSEENKGSDARDSPINVQTPAEESLLPVFSSSENDGTLSEKSEKAFESLNGNVIYCRNDSMTDFDSDLSNDLSNLIDSNYEKTNSLENSGNYIKEITEKEDVVIVCSKGVEEGSNDSKISRELRSSPSKDTEQSTIMLKKKKRFPLLTATIEENNFRRSESPKSNKEVIVRKIWSRKKLAEDITDNDEDSYISMDNSTSIENLNEDESRTEIEKEIIVKKIWSRKKPDFEEELVEKVEENFEDMKINQTEVSDEVVIKCGPKAKSSPKRRKSKSSNEASKDTIMRKIWSGKCTFQTKAALKTYESDVLHNSKGNEEMDNQNKSKRRRRPSSFSTTKRSKVDSDKDDEDDDLDSLLEEIEREQLEKAIRSEFLQLRRSEKANVEMKEGNTPTVGIFTETTLDPRKEVSEKKRRKIKKKIKHPKQSLLKRKTIIRKPFRRVLPSEEKNIKENVNRTGLDEHSENSLDKNVELFRGEGKTKNRKHKKHRHKHHHHKHKHKKSKHHKSAESKHKSKHEFGEKEEVIENTDSFTILEKICQEIPNQIENESQKNLKRRPSSDSKAEEEVFSLECKTSDSPEVEFENGLPSKRHFEGINIYEFVEDISEFSGDRLRNLKK